MASVSQGGCLTKVTAPVSPKKLGQGHKAQQTLIVSGQPWEEIQEVGPIWAPLPPPHWPPPNKGQDSWCTGPQMLSDIPSGANSAPSQRLSSLCQDRTLHPVQSHYILGEWHPWSCAARPLQIKVMLSPAKPRHRSARRMEGVLRVLSVPFCNPRQVPSLSPPLPYTP